MNNFNKKLIEYGVPFTEVMERFVNDEELYCSCFQSFLEDSSFVALSTAIQLKDYNMAFEYAHTLKGVAGNLGLTPLYNIICNIVEQLRNNNYTNLEQNYKCLLQEHEKLQHFLDDYPDND